MTTFESLQAVARRPVSVDKLEGIASRVDAAAAELHGHGPAAWSAPAQRHLASVLDRQNAEIERMWAQHLERHPAQR